MSAPVLTTTLVALYCRRFPQDANLSVNNPGRHVGLSRDATRHRKSRTRRGIQGRPLAYAGSAKPNDGGARQTRPRYGLLMGCGTPLTHVGGE